MEAHTKGIIVLGAGGHGKSIVSVLIADGMKVLGILDDAPESWNTKIVGVPVLGALELLQEYPDHPVIVGVGDNKQREIVVKRFPKARWTTFKSKQAYINPTAQIGEGTVVFPFAVVGADVQLGDHVIISSHTTLGHDTQVEDYVHITPGVQIAGDACIERQAMLGLSSVICPKVRIGQNATLAAGAVAVYDIEAGSMAYGTPARVKGGIKL